jgi:hypothetical protein
MTTVTVAGAVVGVGAGVGVDGDVGPAGVEDMPHPAQPASGARHTSIATIRSWFVNALPAYANALPESRGVSRHRVAYWRLSPYENHDLLRRS